MNSYWIFIFKLWKQSFIGGVRVLEFFEYSITAIALYLTSRGSYNSACKFKTSHKNSLTHYFHKILEKVRIRMLISLSKFDQDFKTQIYCK